MCPAKLEIGNERHFQSAACCDVLEIAAVRRDEQLAPEEARLFAAKMPRDVGLLGLNLIQINSVRQKNCEPRLGWHCFRIRFVDLNLDLAGLHPHITQSPLPQKHAPRIEFGTDAVSNK